MIFADLNIPWNEGDPDKSKEIVERAFSLGYNTVALNVEINQNDLTTKKSKNKKAKLDDSLGGEKELLLDFPVPPILKEMSKYKQKLRHSNQD